MLIARSQLLVLVVDDLTIGADFTNSMFVVDLP